MNAGGKRERLFCFLHYFNHVHSKCVTVVRGSISEAIFKSEYKSCYIKCSELPDFSGKSALPSSQITCSVSQIYLEPFFWSQKMNVRRSCSTQLFLQDLQVWMGSVGPSAWEQLSSTNTSSCTVISNKSSYPSGVHCKFLTFLYFSFINHCLTWISLNLFYSNACHLYTVR